MNCPTCNGSGYIRRYTPADPMNAFSKGETVEYDCPTCSTTGQVPDPNANERIAAALERIAAVLEAHLPTIGDAVEALSMSEAEHAKDDGDPADYLAARGGLR